jgi:hypothetical protein
LASAMGHSRSNPMECSVNRHDTGKIEPFPAEVLRYALPAT